MSSEGKKHMNVVICGHVDSGKCFAPDTKILMHSGAIKEVQNLTVGEYVMGDDSRPRRITRTTTGTDEMFCITPSNGEPYTVTADHDLVLMRTHNGEIIWDDETSSYWVQWNSCGETMGKAFSTIEYGTSKRAKKEAKKYLHRILPTLSPSYGSTAIVEMKARELYRLSRSERSFYRAFRIGVEFEEKDFHHDPYETGYYMGCVLVNSDEIFECSEEIRWYINKLGCMPIELRTNTREIRMNFLAGLMDAMCSRCGNMLECHFSSCPFADAFVDDFIYLVRSLGLAVRHCCKFGFHQLAICGPDLHKVPIYNNHNWISREQCSDEMLTTAIEIEPVGADTYYGFETDGNHRFLLADFTVTHNSTTTGHLLFELGGIPEREMEKLRTEAEQMGKSSFAFAFYMDRTKEERTRGITIMCTTKEFFTPNFHYTIIDAPGHRDFIKNMLSGAAQADVAVLMVPADGNFATSLARGDHKSNEIKGQTREHARLCNLLGIKQLIVGVNKMDCDTAGYREERYNEIRDEIQNVLIKVGWNKNFVMESVPIIPISGWVGDNLFRQSDKMPWWKGVDVKSIDGTTEHVITLHDALDKYTKFPKRPAEKPIRLPLSGCLSIKGIGDVVTGKLEQGTVKPGMEVVFLPTHTPTNSCTGKVFSIEMHHKSVQEGTCGDNLGLCIKGFKDTKPKNGDIMVLKSDTTLSLVKRFTVQAQILDHPGELKVGYCPIVYCRTAKAPCKMVEIKWKMGKETGNQKVENPPFIKANEMACLVFEVDPKHPIVVEPFQSCECLGRVAIFEGSAAVMLGKVTMVEH